MKRVWIGRVISGLAVLPFVPSALMKFKGGAELTQGLAHLGISESIVVPLAILELACVLVYVVPQTAVLGAILLTGYVGGTIVTHWRVGDPFFIQVALGLLVWLGLYLREPRLADLLPLRKASSR
jgi:hypothetical protein